MTCLYCLFYMTSSSQKLWCLELVIFSFISWELTALIKVNVNTFWYQSTLVWFVTKVWKKQVTPCQKSINFAVDIAFGHEALCTCICRTRWLMCPHQIWLSPSHLYQVWWVIAAPSNINAVELSWSLCKISWDINFFLCSVIHVGVCFMALLTV